MKTILTATLLVLAFGVAMPVHAADVTDPELMKAAVELARQYDANYAKKDANAMAALYEADAILVSPPGPVLHGRPELKAYYGKRFADGAHSHAIKVLETHVQGADGGYGLIEFSVTVPNAEGKLHDVKGHIVAVYRRSADGWHIRIFSPSSPQT